MKKIIKIALLLVLITYPGWVVATNSNFTHTNTPIELKLVSSYAGTQYAGICFMGAGDCGGGGFDKSDEDMSISFPPMPEEQCQNEGFVIACKEGEVTDTICLYQPNYKKCKCNPCEGYNYTLAETTVQGYVSDGSCQSCEMIKYKRKENHCSGYNSCECGGEIGANVCYTGSVKKFSNCKTCKPVRAQCQVGWIYYSDGTCNQNKLDGKTPIGVVVRAVYDGGGQVIASSPIGEYPAGDYDFGGYSGPEKLPILFPFTMAMYDYNSCENTGKFINDGNSQKYPAARAARNYVPSGGFATYGKWCLPAAGVLADLVKFQEVINTGLAKIGGTQIPGNADGIGDCFTNGVGKKLYWSSSMVHGGAYWFMTTGICYENSGSGGRLDIANYDTSISVRPVLEF